MMNYYLGVDVGTTSTKAVAFSDKGEVIATHSVAYSMRHPQPNQSEQDPDEIAMAVIASINKVVEMLLPGLPAFVSFSSAMHSLVLVDEAGKPLTACIIWADNRASEVAEILRNTEFGNSIYHTTGVPIHSMSPLCKLIWMKQYEPLLFSTAHKFISIKEYIFFKLFGQFIVDTSVASATGLLNIKTLQWEEAILKFLEISPARLSQVVPVNFALCYNHPNPILSLPPDTKIFIGGGDGALSNLGTGATASNTMAISIGTSGAARMIVKEARTDRLMRTFCYHVKENDYIVGGATNNGAIVLQWLRETLLQTSDSYDENFEHAQTIAPGSDGLLFLPYILGERAPIWDSNAKGVYFGLAIQHTKAHLIRAAMEGVIYSLYSIGKVLLEGTEVTELHASGGFARSALWLQMLADVFNIKVLVSGSVESAALGAAMIGADSVGFEQLFDNNLIAVYEPDLSIHKIYSMAFQKFERLYDLLKDEMKETVLNSQTEFKMPGTGNPLTVNV